SIVFITHKLNEIKAVADRCTVLRRGKFIGVVDVASTSQETLSEMMVGRKIDLNIQLAAQKPGKQVLQVDKLCIHSRRRGYGKMVLNDVSFAVRQG
ncbi:MAG TPA: heme ABC transporter ATP-binding protein, partial [Firmicutes bacterium]|nr:heme ABC transporter ATP-binding protein [Bacillota bacterium]